jgi:hypothetical protein
MAQRQIPARMAHGELGRGSCRARSSAGPVPAPREGWHPLPGSSVSQCQRQQPTALHHLRSLIPNDAERMGKGDPDAESVFLWTKEKKRVNRCGAGPMDASLFGRGVGEGLSVHICPTPVDVRGARGGRDRVAHYRRDTRPNPQYPGKGFGSNAAAWCGFHYKDCSPGLSRAKWSLIYEVDGPRTWTPQIDPSAWYTTPSTILAFS